MEVLLLIQCFYDILSVKRYLVIRGAPIQFTMADMLIIVKDNIANRAGLKERQIDAIVNAAKSTLMGSNQGVDGAIHKAVPNLNEIIFKELGGEYEENRIRCPSGHAVLTSGGDLCKYIVHVVGPRYDGNGGSLIDCSSSRINALESCYYEIIKCIREHLDIRNIAIPVISSGDYGFPFKIAVEVAIAGICNAIMDWEIKNPESFEMAKLERIYLYVYHDTPERKEEYFQCAQRMLQKYRPILKRNKRVVFQPSWKAHLRYWKEVREYDEHRGYFFAQKRCGNCYYWFDSCFCHGWN